MASKVLILYNNLFHYRIPVWNILAQSYDLTVAYTYDAKQKDIDMCNFETIQLPYRVCSKIVLHKDNIFRLCQNYDVVIAFGQISFLKFSTLGFKKRKFKLINWCIGAPAGYKRHYGDGGKFYHFANDFFHRKADALVFYSQPAVDMHVSRGFSREKLFVANNTVEVVNCGFQCDNRRTILFIGTIYLEKGLQFLLDSYKRAYDADPNVISLTIVGGGTQFEVIKKWIYENGLTRKITMTGPVYEAEKKAELFIQSLACISPLQAGLSVLESMGYGVPFITSENAITGGESFNIQDGISGYRMKDISKLTDVILDISKFPNRYLEMGKNAYEHYWNNRKPKDMARGLHEAIKYVLK